MPSQQELATPITLQRLILLLLIPVAILGGSLYFAVQSFRLDLRIANEEIVGLHELETLYLDLRFAQRIRHWQLMIDGGYTEGAADLEKARQNFMQQTQAILAEQHAQAFGVAEPLEKIRDSIAAIETQSLGENNNLTRYDAYREPITSLQETIRRLWDNASFSVDPARETSHLSLLLFLRLPALSETLGRIRSLSSYSQLSTSHKQKVSLHLRDALRDSRSELRRMRWEIQELQEIREMQQGLVKLMQEMADTTALYIDAVEADNAAAPGDVRAHFKAGTEAISEVHDTANYAADALAQRLQTRQKKSETNLTLILLSAALSLLLLLSATFWLYQRNRAAFTHLVEVRDDLAEAEAKQRAILDNVVDGVISIDAHGIMHSFNPATEKIFGYAAQDVLGHNINILMPEPYASAHDGYLHAYQNGGPARIIGIGREVQGKRADGSVFPLDLAVSEVRLNDQTMYTGIVRDITERKRIEQMKNEFISTVSHELRTPLTSIRGSLGLIAGGVTGALPEQAQAMLNIATNNTERLLMLINDILDIQKIEAGKMNFHFETHDLGKLVERAVGDMQGYAAQNAVRFVITRTIDDVQVFADRDRLLQVLANLLSNAAKFSPREAQVEVALARHHDGRVRVSITDYGPGIPEEFQARMFQHFSQSDSSDTRAKGGTGLGLAITKAIVERHGGLLNFVTREGYGTTFYFELPEMQHSALTDTAHPNPLPGKHCACVLIVEDDRDVAALIQRMLTEAGFDSDVAHSAQEARTLLAAHGPQYKLMTLDLQLPDESGMHLLDSLRRDASTLDLPVVVVSGTADEVKKQINGSAMGILDWLQKPIDQTRLIAVIKQAAKPNRLPRVLHVEDEPDVRTVVAAMLQDHCELHGVDTIKAAQEALESMTFDLVLLDIGLPDGSGLDLIGTIKYRVTPPRIVIFSAMDVSEQYADQVNAVLVKSRTNNQDLLNVLLGNMKRG